MEQGGMVPGPAERSPAVLLPMTHKHPPNRWAISPTNGRAPAKSELRSSSCAAEGGKREGSKPEGPRRKAAWFTRARFGKAERARHYTQKS